MGHRHLPKRPPYAQQLSHSTPASLDRKVASDSELTVGDLLAGADLSGSAAEARVVLAPLVRRLSERDKKVLRLRFFDDCTQQEIAQQIGVTQTQVSRLLSRILGELRDALEEPNLAVSASDFAHLSRDLMADLDERPTLQTVAEHAVAVVPACEFASVSLRRRRGRVETTASTSDLASMCDALQYTLEEGPCLEAVWDGDSYLAEDIANDGRWPRWGPRVAKLGVASVLSIRLSTESETIGAPNLYATQAGAFTSDDVDLSLIFTVHATNALNSARLVSGLQTAVQSRHLIGVAQGILMTTYDLTMDQSFELLRRYSSQTNTKIRDIAQHVADSGSLPRGGDASVSAVRSEPAPPSA